ncbi:MAG: hypothetical protein A2W19_02705 [Spirochaetes bacterium RBG_16_49_21]|nr:MAG: hypothetical protein A2W19_02705 [Spirochaetes bacterium RBG_16_49_21]
MKACTTNTWFVYMLECENGSLYTGCTDDLARRFNEHRKGTGRSKYTRSFKPVRVAASWKIAGSKGSALRMERLIKGMDRKTKQALAHDPRKLRDIVPGISGSDIVSCATN